MRNAVVVLLVTLVAGIVQAQEVNIGPSQASIAGRVASKMKTSLDPLDVTTTIRCEHSLMLCREEVSIRWVTDEGNVEVKHDIRIWDVQVWSTDTGRIQANRDGNTLQFSREENLIVHHHHKDGIETVGEFTIVNIDKQTAQK
jgi:hypothetical protein